MHFNAGGVYGSINKTRVLPQSPRRQSPLLYYVLARLFNLLGLLATVIDLVAAPQGTTSPEDVLDVCSAPVELRPFHSCCTSQREAGLAPTTSHPDRGALSVVTLGSHAWGGQGYKH